VRDIDTVVVDSLKALDPKRPIREADMTRTRAYSVATDGATQSALARRCHPNQLRTNYLWRVALKPQPKKLLRAPSTRDP
jgi:hypothetical protein